MSEDVLSDAFFDARERDLKKSGLARPNAASSMREACRRRPRRWPRRTASTCARRAWPACCTIGDKEYGDDEIRERARALGVDVDPYVLDTMPRLLHGPTAAAELVRAYPDLSADVVQAIARHTAAAVGMSDLDMIIYIADAIEPSRDFDGLDELRAAIGAVPLEELFMMTFNHILLTLVERRRRLHPATVEVWNHYVARSRDAKAEKGTA